MACDLQRPAAIDQLQQLGRQVQIPVYAPDLRTRSRPRGSAWTPRARTRLDVVVLDTAGRLHVDEELMDELQRVRDATKPTNVLFVLDAMTGQEAVNVALAFQERIAFDGVVLTKLDGDERRRRPLGPGRHGSSVKLASVGRSSTSSSTSTRIAWPRGSSAWGTC